MDFDIAVDGGLVNPGTALGPWTHNNSGNLIWIPCFGDLVANDATGAKITSATVDGNNAALIRKIAENNGSTPSSDRWCYLFLYQNAPTGNRSIQVNASSNTAISAGSISYKLAATNGQPDQSTTNFSGGVGSITTNLASIANACWFVAFGKNSSANPTAGAGATIRLNGGSGVTFFDSNGPQPIGTYSMTLNLPGADTAMIMASFIPLLPDHQFAGIDIVDDYLEIVGY